ncbi:MAG: hypothetical protein WCO30_02565 [bacterium]
MKALFKMMCLVILVALTHGCCIGISSPRYNVVLDGCKMTENCSIWPAPNNTIMMQSEVSASIDILDWEAKLVGELTPGGRSFEYFNYNLYNSPELIFTVVPYRINQYGYKERLNNQMMVYKVKLVYSGDLKHTFTVKESGGRYFMELVTTGIGVFSQPETYDYRYQRDKGGWWSSYDGQWHEFDLRH